MKRMNKSKIKALGITQKEIDALDVILNSAIPGASLAVAYLQAALGTIESAEDGEGTKQPGGPNSNRPDDAGKQRKPSGLDSLGGGNIL
jgi:hypothetical protein